MNIIWARGIEATHDYGIVESGVRVPSGPHYFGRVAQLVRASRLHREGLPFESGHAHSFILALQLGLLKKFIMIS